MFSSDFIRKPGLVVFFVFSNWLELLLENCIATLLQGFKNLTQLEKPTQNHWICPQKLKPN
jgi:hypothetical protein